MFGRSGGGKSRVKLSDPFRQRFCLLIFHRLSSDPLYWPQIKYLERLGLGLVGF